MDVTAIAFAPNGCPVSSELRLDVAFSIDKPLRAAVWDIKVSSIGGIASVDALSAWLWSPDVDVRNCRVGVWWLRHTW